MDWSRCAGHGLCGHLVPEVVQLDVFGYPVLTESELPARLLPDALRAAEMCPALALGLSRTPSVVAPGRHATR
ncbi:ferredoxin [Nonomuraea sp. NPDC050022]|uniref:ferredoxin n=1 Tax=Nonomuraea sp. NPDC050022 TaxID=3364358 RepID=UPI0037A4B8C8